MTNRFTIGERKIGPGHPTYIVGEIGINHNGDIEIAKSLIDAAAKVGCDAVKFQKRTPEICVPLDQRDVMRETPWGYISYMDYRYKIEFEEEYQIIDEYCKYRGIEWFSSCWDLPSVDFMETFNPPCYKIPSACLTDTELLQGLRKTGRPLILSTGMSSMEQINTAVETLGQENLLITHCTSTYPCPDNELNLNMIKTLSSKFDCPIGYSGHEVGLPTSVCAVALGACLIERHITLARAMWGSDQGASVEPIGMERLVRYIRTLEAALGTGVKEVYDSELPVAHRLRRVQTQ